MKQLEIFFNKPLKFDIENIQYLIGITGLYFIFLDKLNIRYPFGSSKLIYIGMSEKKSNSIGKRLSDHFEGLSGNEGITNYKKVDNLLFTYINFQMLKNIRKFSIEDLESYFIIDFVKKYGVYPICNNKTGYNILKNELDVLIKIDWKYFE